nr:3'-5' exonuclease [Polaribacter vadi]
MGSDAKNPFHIKKEIKSLETNFRSYSEVVNFNNSFFQFTSNFLNNESYKNLFVDGNKQLENTKKGGFVSLNFLDKEEDKDDEKIKYPKKVLEKINQLKDSFSLGEICVLTRTKKDGIAVANYLSENGVNIVSSETLLLQNSNKVTFIVDVLKLLQNPNDEETRFEILYFLYQHLQIESTKHVFLKEFAKVENIELFKALKKYGISFEILIFNQLPFYEKIEEIIRSFKLVKSSDAYVQFFLDVVLEQQRKSIDINSFLELWELKKERLSIVAAESANAVQIMTIHKSKGLEFPVVIFPCDVDVYRQINPKVWLDELPENYEGFKELLVDFNKSLVSVSTKGEHIYHYQRQELELDNFNLLYVGLTRAVEQLHIITERKISTKGEVNTNFYSGVLINYLKEQNLWSNDNLEYSFGKVIRISGIQNENTISQIHEKFISTPWQEHNVVLLANSSKLWDTNQGEAIDFGNLFHEILSKIFTKNEVEKVLKQYVQQGVINDLESKSLVTKINDVVNHPKINKYFSEDVLVYNEREIVDVDNQIVIPDRLVFVNDSIVIIDYKTGFKSSKHKQQLLKYEQVLKSMSFKVDKKLLVYINDEIEIIKV